MPTTTATWASNATPLWLFWALSLLTPLVPVPIHSDTAAAAVPHCVRAAAAAAVRTTATIFIRKGESFMEKTAKGEAGINKKAFRKVVRELLDVDGNKGHPDGTSTRLYSTLEHSPHFALPSPFLLVW